jgi:vacuolar-type H+-ATPase subunit I/STV1
LGGARGAAERVAARWLNADFLYEKRPPEEDEIYYPSGTNYSPSGGNGYYKFDPSNKERKPSEVQNTDGEQPDVGNTSRVVPNGQFVKASDHPQSLKDLVNREIDLIGELNKLEKAFKETESSRNGERLKVHRLSREQSEHFKKILILLDEEAHIEQAVSLADAIDLLGNLRRELLIRRESVREKLREIRKEIKEWNEAEDKRMEKMMREMFNRVAHRYLQGNLKC